MIMEGESRGGMESVSGKPGRPHGDAAATATVADVKDLVGVIEEVGMYGGYRKTQKKECFNLVRRLKLLVPPLEEIGELHHGGGGSLSCLVGLNRALLSAKKLLKQCSCGSKIFLALEHEAVMARFHAVYDKLNSALDDIPYDEIGVSVEVKEQVELMGMQLKRAKRRADTQDIELAMDLMVVMSQKGDDRNADNAIFQRLANKLELCNVGDLRDETTAVGKLVRKSRQNSESVQQIARLLDKFRQIAGVENLTSTDAPASAKTLEKCRSLFVPHEFLCPISLEIMTDPVIISTGQTYERESIRRWLDSNHRTCPKTGQVLDHLSLAPNYALRNLILQWCEKNNFELPKKDNKVLGIENSSLELINEISSLIRNLSSPHLDELRKAIAEIRTLSKENPDNRMLIANSGAVPPLVMLLSCSDPKIQENAVTALLNLSLNESNKRVIAREGAIPAIIEILRNGTQEARENSAAALFSISMLDENKALIGALKGIPPLVGLLKDGTLRGKKDAATAIFNLSLHQPNKSRAIKAGVIPHLLRLLEDKNLGMVDESLSILLLLASHPEGRNQISQMSFIKTLVEIIAGGTPKNKECATCVLLELGMNNSSCLLAALQFGVYEHLVEITRTGTNRAQRKANSLLQHMSKSEHIP